MFSTATSYLHLLTVTISLVWWHNDRFIQSLFLRIICLLCLAIVLQFFFVGEVIWVVLLFGYCGRNNLSCSYKVDETLFSLTLWDGNFVLKGKRSSLSHFVLMKCCCDMLRVALSAFFFWRNSKELTDYVAGKSLRNSPSHILILKCWCGQLHFSLSFIFLKEVISILTAHC